MSEDEELNEIDELVEDLDSDEHGSNNICSNDNIIDGITYNRISNCALYMVNS